MSKINNIYVTCVKHTRHTFTFMASDSHFPSYWLRLAIKAARSEEEESQ